MRVAVDITLFTDPACPFAFSAAAEDVDLDGEELARWSATAAVEDALRADIEAARSPSPAARALDHKLGGPPTRAATPHRATSSAPRAARS